jgi:hypothetical protein
VEFFKFPITRRNRRYAWPDPKGFFGQRRLRDDDGRYFALGSNSKEGLELRSCSGTSGERLDRGGFVLMDIEHAVQFGGFQQIEDVDRGL